MQYNIETQNFELNFGMTYDLFELEEAVKVGLVMSYFKSSFAEKALEKIKKTGYLIDRIIKENYSAVKMNCLGCHSDFWY